MLLCNRSYSKPHNVFFIGTLLFVIAVLTSVLVHPATDFGRGFVIGFTAVLFAGEIALMLVYLVSRSRQNSPTANR